MMSRATVLEPPIVGPAGAPTESVSDSAALRSKHARAGKAMALATFAMAAASGLQALLYLRSFGVDGRTDGFFAAFALYATFGIFSQSIRVTSAPLLVGSRPSMTAGQFAAALGLIAVPVLLVTGPLAGPLARLLAPGLNGAGRHVTEAALPVLGTAMVLQLWAAGAATLLAVRDRFGPVAAAYGAGAVAGLGGYVALEGTAGRLTLGWSMLLMAVVTFAVMLAGARHRAPAGAPPHPTGALHPRRLIASAGSIMGRTGIYLAFNGLYLVTLAFAGGYGAGNATVVSYAYLFASYLVAGTGFALGMARVADMTRGARSQWRDVLGGTVPQGFRYAMLLSAPALAGLVAFGAPLVGALLPSSLPAHEVALLQRCAILLLPWTIAAQMVNLLLPVMFALGRARLVNACAPVLIAVQLAVTAAGGALFGVYGVVGAAFVAPLGFAVLMLVAEGRERAPRLASEMARDALHFVLLAGASFGGASLLALAVPAGAGRSVVCALIGSAGYVLGLRVTASHQMQMLLRRSTPQPRAHRA